MDIVSVKMHALYALEPAGLPDYICTHSELNLVFLPPLYPPIANP